MFRVKVDSETSIQANFNGILTKAEEEVYAWKAIGKSNAAIALLTGKSEDAVKKQLQNTYKKTAVSGADNPGALLSIRAFKHGWISFCHAVLVLSVCTSFTPTNREINRSLTRTSITRSFKDELPPLTSI